MSLLTICREAAAEAGVAPPASNQEWRSDAVRSSGAHVHSITGNTASTGGGSTHNNVQPTAILNWIIKT